MGLVVVKVGTRVSARHKKQPMASEQERLGREGDDSMAYGSDQLGSKRRQLEPGPRQSVGIAMSRCKIRSSSVKLDRRQL